MIGPGDEPSPNVISSSNLSGDALFATVILPTGVMHAPVPQQKASLAFRKSLSVTFPSLAFNPHSAAANSRMDALVTPGRIVSCVSDGVMMVLFGITAKKLDAPASSTASPLSIKQSRKC